MDPAFGSEPLHSFSSFYPNSYRQAWCKRSHFHQSDWQIYQEACCNRWQWHKFILVLTRSLWTPITSFLWARSFCSWWYRCDTSLVLVAFSGCLWTEDEPLLVPSQWGLVATCLAFLAGKFGWLELYHCQGSRGSDCEPSERYWVVGKNGKTPQFWGPETWNNFRLRPCQHGSRGTDGHESFER